MRDESCADFPSTETFDYGCIDGAAGLVAGLARATAQPTVSSVEPIFASIPQLIAEARAGRPFIMVDSYDRENEGDLIIPAQFANHREVNFMARHARGLICLAITGERAAELRLRPMVEDNASPLGTAFTVSIEAATGVSTGISARDRALTIATAVDPARSHADLISPGHIFPLVAKTGGVLERAGHTEAAVDIARLAGLIPAGVICEIMNDDGSMARLPDLRLFARAHDLQIGAIEDLIAWRRASEGTAGTSAHD